MPEALKRPARTPTPEPVRETATSVHKPVTPSAAPVKRLPRNDPAAAMAAGPNTPIVSAAHAGRPPVAAIIRPSHPVVELLDDRRLSKAQKTKLEVWAGSKRDKAMDSYLAGITERARTKFGHEAVMAASEMDNLIVGIPCPALVFEYIIAQDCFPLGLVFHLSGATNTNKSALLSEFFRWFLLAEGLGNLFEVESKISTDFLPSIVGYDMAKHIMVDNCVSVEDWQAHLQYWLQEHKIALTGTKENPGPGRTVPILFGVDSIMGKEAWETQEKVRDVGAGGRAFPLAALSITQFMKTVPGDLTGWPFAICLNNHRKAGTDDKGHEVWRTGGGSGVGFQESFELATSIRKSNIECADWKGRIINIKCWKNSYGDTYRNADTRILWWEELDAAASAEAGRQIWRQKTVWDWHWATVKLLTTLEGQEKARLDDAFHIRAVKTSEVENTAWSKNLGMKAEDAVSWAQLGAVIAADPVALEAIRGALSIKRRPLLQGDYLKQQQKLAEQLP